MKTGKLWKALILAGIVGIAGGLAGCGGEKADCCIVQWKENREDRAHGALFPIRLCG